MKATLEIPEIIIPGYKIEIDISNGEVINTWERVTNMLEELCLCIEEPKGEISSEDVCNPINNMIEQIYAQLIEAEEKYAELIKY